MKRLFVALVFALALASCKSEDSGPAAPAQWSAPSTDKATGEIECPLSGGRKRMGATECVYLMEAEQKAARTAAKQKLAPEKPQPSDAQPSPPVTSTPQPEPSEKDLALAKCLDYIATLQKQELEDKVVVNETAKQIAERIRTRFLAAVRHSADAICHELGEYNSLGPAERAKLFPTTTLDADGFGAAYEKEREYLLANYRIFLAAAEFDSGSASPTDPDYLCKGECILPRNHVVDQLVGMLADSKFPMTDVRADLTPEYLAKLRQRGIWELYAFWVFEPPSIKREAARRTLCEEVWKKTADGLHEKEVEQLDCGPPPTMPPPPEHQ